MANEAGRTSATPSMIESADSLSLGDFVYKTPFEIYVGPQRDRTMAHRELLIQRSPYIARICNQSVELAPKHERLVKLHEEVKESMEGPYINNQETLLKAFRKIFLRAPTCYKQGLQNTVYQSMKTHCSRKAGSLTYDEHSEFLDWAVSKLQMCKAPAVTSNVLKSANTYIFHLVCSSKKDDDPAVSAIFNQLFLPSTSLKAVQLIIDCVYRGSLRKLSTHDSDALVTLCHLNALAAQLEMYDVANECMDLLTTKHNLIIESSVALPILKLAQRAESSKYWNKVGKLVLDMLAAADAEAITDEQIEGIQQIAKHLDTRAARYLAGESMSRNRALKSLRKDQEASAVDVPVKIEGDPSREESAALPSGILDTPFSDPVQVCRKYHWHGAGQGCFPETKRPSETETMEKVEKTEKAETATKQTTEMDTSRATSIQNSIEGAEVGTPAAEATTPAAEATLTAAVDQLAGMKRKADSQDEE